MVGLIHVGLISVTRENTWASAYLNVLVNVGETGDMCKATCESTTSKLLSY